MILGHIYGLVDMWCLDQNERVFRRGERKVLSSNTMGNLSERPNVYAMVFYMKVPNCYPYQFQALL